MSYPSTTPEVLLRIYQAALRAADPRVVLPRHLPAPPRGKTVVVGLGKAAAAMAQALEQHWQGPLQGVVVVPQGAKLPLQHIEQIESSHPLPDESSVRGARALLQAVQGLEPDDLVIALVSGGGSALACAPIDGLDLATKQALTRALLARGASISEINTLRKHVSAFKGGRLAAAAYPAKLVSLLISDIPGDDVRLIASGPSLPDASTCADALAVLHKYAPREFPAIEAGLQSGAWESVKPDDPRILQAEHHLIATAWDGLKAAQRQARQEGLSAYILSDRLEGESRELAKAHAGLALSIACHGEPFARPCVLLSGGEATVTLKGQGRGGRNTEFVLALALALAGEPLAARMAALSAGTDGLDGSAGAAGAWLDHKLLTAIAADPARALAYLDRNDSASLLDDLGYLIHTGPTQTNINDIRVLLVG